MAGDPEEVQARLRAYVRANHPDRGGDPNTFADGLARLRAELADTTHPEPRPRVTVTPAANPLTRVARAIRRRRRPPRVR